MFRHRFMILMAGLLFLLSTVSSTGPAAGMVVAPEPEFYPHSNIFPAEIVLTSRSQLLRLVESGIDVGDLRWLDASGRTVSPDAPWRTMVATVYLSPEQAGQLRDAGLPAVPIRNAGARAFSTYGPGTRSTQAWPTLAEIEARLQAIADTYPTIVRKFSLGQSVQGRDIWALKITDYPELEEDEPEFRYTSTMHGDEPVGMEMVLRLAELLASNYGSDAQLTALVDGIEIWLCPLHNPDGYVNGTRYNAYGIDLNRDFPDPVTDPFDDPADRQIETQLMMQFGYQHSFVMGTNFHGGAQVVSIPWDSQVTIAPDDATLMAYGKGYAARNPFILAGGFTDGVTRGWEWYIVHGSLQDWAYHWYAEHHITIELSNLKWPPYDQMDSHWDANREAMIWWMQHSLTGARGLVTDASTGAPLAATVDVAEIGKPVFTDPDVGDYHQLLLPGDYTLNCSANNYISQTWSIEVISGTASVQDCALQPLPAPGVSLETERDSLTVRPGDTVSYSLLLSNSGNVTDSFAISVAGNDWPTAISAASVGPLAPDSSDLVTVAVTMPVATTGTADMATVRAVADSNVAIYDELTLTTRRVSFPIYLPLLVR